MIDRSMIHHYVEIIFSHNTAYHVKGSSFEVVQLNEELQATERGGLCAVPDLAKHQIFHLAFVR